MPLKKLNSAGAPVQELSPLKGLPLEILRASIHLFHSPNEEFFRSLSVKRLNGPPWPQVLSREEYWKEFDRRKAQAEAFVVQTARLPAD